jgi:hypothetical protein
MRGESCLDHESDWRFGAAGRPSRELIRTPLEQSAGNPQPGKHLAVTPAADNGRPQLSRLTTDD